MGWILEKKREFLCRGYTAGKESIGGLHPLTSVPVSQVTIPPRDPRVTFGVMEGLQAARTDKISTSRNILSHENKKKNNNK